MSHERVPAWDAKTGTAGGAAVGSALRELAAKRDLDEAALARGVELEPAELAAVLAGERRINLTELARFAVALRLRAIEFLQQAGFLSLEVYAAGLDPLYFLPPGQVRHDARIYMREINPRHAVPERDMLVRNPVFKALMSDEVIDPFGRMEIELAYLLRAAAIQTGGTL